MLLTIIVLRGYYIKKARHGRDIIGLHFFTSLIRHFENSKEQFFGSCSSKKKAEQKSNAKGTRRNVIVCTQPKSY